MLFCYQVRKSPRNPTNSPLRLVILTALLAVAFLHRAEATDLAPSADPEVAYQNTPTFSIAPLRNVAFDRAIVGPSSFFGMNSLEQLNRTIEEDSLASTNGIQSPVSPNNSFFSGGYADRLICASNFLKRKLTCEVELSPNHNGVFPNLFTLVLTEGRNPNHPDSVGQYAEIVFDLTDSATPIVSAYVYSSSTNIESWLSSSTSSPFPAPIVSTLQPSPRTFVRELIRERSTWGFPRIRFTLDTTPILNYDPTWTVPNLPTPLTWIGVGFGDSHTAQLTTYVNAKVDYTLAFGPFSEAEQFFPTPGFIRSLTAEGKTTIPIQTQDSCNSCTSIRTTFHRPSFWRAFHSILSEAVINVPCKSSGVFAASKEVAKWLEADPFSASYVAAQLSVRSKHKREAYYEALRTNFGVYGEPLLDAEIVRFNADDVLTVSSKLSDLFQIAQKEAARCEPVSSLDPNGPKKKTVTPTSEKLAEFFKKLETVSTTSTTSAVRAAAVDASQVRRTAQAKKTTVKKKTMKKGVKKAAKKAAKKKAVEKKR